jgi:protein O-mannosyl-transferase
VKTKATHLWRKPVVVGITILIVIASFAVYLNALANGFVFDDEYQVVRNPWIKSFRNIPTVFSTGVWGFEGAGPSNYYRPAMHLLYMVTFHICGASPWGFHAVNIGLHAAVSVLVFFLVVRVLTNSGVGTPLFPAGVAAILFATHPIHTEAVTSVMSVTDVALTFFYILSLYFHIRSSENGKTGLIFSVPAFFLATLCKETALTLPLILVAYDLILVKGGFTFARLWKRHLPYLVVIVLYFAARTHALGAFVPSTMNKQLNLYESILNVFPLVTLYVRKLLLPTGLNALYAFDPSFYFDQKLVVSLVATLFIAGAFYLSARREKTVFWCLLLIFVPLLPTLYIPALSHPFAERYLYLPSVGFVLVIAALLPRVAGTPGRMSVVAAVLTAVTGWYSFATIQRNIVWKDNYSLWSDTVTKSPNDAMVRNNLGLALAHQGRLEEAIIQYTEALRINPDDDFTHYNLGIALGNRGRLEEAAYHYAEVLRIKPNDREARALLEVTRAQLKNAQGH